MSGKVKLNIKNQLEVNIQFCSGIDIERELATGEIVAFEASDGDFMYLYQVTEVEKKEAS